MSAHRQGVRIFGINLGQTSQMGQSGINDSSILTDPLDLCLGPQRFPPRVPVNIEAGSSRRAQGTQLIDSVSASRPNNLVGQSDQSHGSHGPIDARDLVSEDEYEDDEDDDGDDEEEDDEEEDEADDDEEDDGGDAASGDDDVIVSSPIASGQATSSRRRPLMMRAINDPGLVAETAARNRRRRINNDPLPSNSNLEVAAPPPPPPRRPPTFNCQICFESYFEGMATICGHIFCNDCITEAVTAQGRCPSCREMITLRGLLRISVPNPL